MTDFAAARDNMVEGQIKPNHTTDPRLIAALREIPREAFVPAGRRAAAYIDEDVEIAPGRYLMEPMVFARLVQSLAPLDNDLALDIGGGSGYSAAVLSRLVGAVVAVEEDKALAVQAAKALSDLGCDNVVLTEGALSNGAAAQGPYDVILLNGSVEVVPDTLLNQLKEGGRLAAVVNVGGVGKAMLYLKTPAGVGRRELFNAAIPPLPGFAAPKGFVF